MTVGFHGAGTARAEERRPAADTMIGEWRWLAAAVWSRLRDDGLGTAPVTLCPVSYTHLTLPTTPYV